MRLSFALAQDQDNAYILENDKHIAPHMIPSKLANNEIILIQIDGSNIGWLRFGYFWDSIPFMNMLWIDDQHRGKGIGREAVLFWENQMKAQGFGMVMTSTLSNEEAQHFYRKLGYQDAGSLLLANQALEIIFTKKLPKNLP